MLDLYGYDEESYDEKAKMLKCTLKQFNRISLEDIVEFLKKQRRNRSKNEIQFVSKVVLEDEEQNKYTDAFGKLVKMNVRTYW